MAIYPAPRQGGVGGLSQLRVLLCQTNAAARISLMQPLCMAGEDDVGLLRNQQLRAWLPAGSWAALCNQSAWR